MLEETPINGFFVFFQL